MPIGDNRFLFDHLVGADQKRFRNCDPKRLRGLEIDDKLELGRLFYGQIGRLDAAQDLGDLRGHQHCINRPKSKWRRTDDVGYQPSCSAAKRLRC